MSETTEAYRRRLEESDRLRRRERAFLPYSEKVAIVMKLRRVKESIGSPAPRV